MAGRSGIESRWGRDFPPIQTGPVAHTASIYDGYRVFSGGKVRQGRAADHSPPSSAAVMEEYSYTSTHPVGHTWPVTGSLYMYLCFSLHVSFLVKCHLQTIKNIEREIIK